MDVIAYIPDLTAFRIEAETLAKNNIHGFSFDEAGKLQYNVSKIPVVYKNNTSVCLLRLTTKDDISAFKSLNTVENIGYYDKVTNKYIFKTGGKTKYESVYDTTPKTILIDGADTIYQPPYMIGVFA